MRRYFPELVGNDGLCEQLGSEIAGGKLTHACILEGRKGIGKHTLSMQIAAALSCEHRQDEGFPLPCGTCDSCRKIFFGFSPDVSVIGKGDKASIGTDVIRQLRQDVSVAPNDTDTKVYIIEEADLMTVQAQNAFLLTLEEPPAYVLFLLLCENAASLLETVRSRVPVYRLRPLSSDMIADLLVKKSSEAAKLKANDPAAYREVVAIADGSLGRAMELTDEKKRTPILSLRRTAKCFTDLFSAGKNSADAIRYFSGLPTKREDLILCLEEIRLCLHDILLSKQAEEPPLRFFADRESAALAAERLSVALLLHLCDCVTNAIERLRHNANAKLTLTLLGKESGLLH